MKIVDKLATLRDRMCINHLDAYIVRGSDPHASEYMANHWEEMSWLSGFLGESGTVVVTAKEALLWTDSRYYIQAEKELAGSTISLMRASDIDCPSIEQWLLKSFSDNGHNITVGVNAQMYSYNDYIKLANELSRAGIELKNIDLIQVMWVENRPPIPQSILQVYDVKYAGEDVKTKISRVRTALKNNGADVIIISALDEIGWLLNIRGTDVAYTPCIISYVVLQNDRCVLFIDPNKIDEQGKDYLSSINIETQSYDAIYPYLQSLHGRTVMFDGSRTNYSLVQAVIDNNKVVNTTPSPVQVFMSIKNDIEISGVRQAMLKDGVALTRFFMWLDSQIERAEKNKTTCRVENLTEIDLADKLHDFRSRGDNFRDESFCTIVAVGENGAIVHYHSDRQNCAPVVLNEVLLLDSGGQYLDGTTDITRTIWLGNNASLIPERVKRDYTLVLKGHIALANAVFPAGTRGNQLDVLAHQYMWKEGITYTHGTGHGVGHFMGCHEGPQNIRTDNNPNPLRCGNICSDEPGIYREGQYGIRTENLVLVTPNEPQKDSTGENYFRFETLTLCFYDTRLIDRSMLSPDEITWINQYHKTVFDKISPLLQAEEVQYLSRKCRPIE